MSTIQTSTGAARYFTLCLFRPLSTEPIDFLTALLLVSALLTTISPGAPHFSTKIYPTDSPTAVQSRWRRCLYGRYYMLVPVPAVCAPHWFCSRDLLFIPVFNARERGANFRPISSSLEFALFQNVIFSERHCSSNLDGNILYNYCKYLMDVQAKDINTIAEYTVAQYIARM